jgi:hypothetical protein
MFNKIITKDLPPMILIDLLYLIVIIYYVRRYVFAPTNRTALELNENEIIDHVSCIRVKWSNVSDISFKKRGYNSNISVYVNDKKEVIQQTNNILKRLTLYLIASTTGTPLKIPLMHIKGEDSFIYDRIKKYFKEVKARELTLPDLIAKD